jgi:15-cis-phytoene synthase/lycopene beta-cyclase
MGPRLFDIPMEEVFFFFIQTYNTTLLYVLLGKLAFKPLYIYGGKGLGKVKAAKLKYLRRKRLFGQIFLGTGVLAGAVLTYHNGPGTYLGLILVWAGPVAFLTWTLGYQMLLELPYLCTAAPVLLPTLYLWVVDTLALQRGTWSITSGTKLGIHVWPHLEIEEAVFFLATNLLIVLGLVAFDTGLSILELFPELNPKLTATDLILPPLGASIRALLISPEEYDQQRIQGLHNAVERLKKKSRSFYIASAVFEGRLRIDLTLLYSFCRTADDLIDNASSLSEAKANLNALFGLLDVYRKSEDLPAPDQDVAVSDYLSTHFSQEVQLGLQMLPMRALADDKPVFDLLKGFEMDMGFDTMLQSGAAEKIEEAQWPIATDADLQEYARCVAGTVAEMCVDLVHYHYLGGSLGVEEAKIKSAAGKMGIALQYVNIARDIKVDAKMDRVYIPYSWLQEVDLTPVDVVRWGKAVGGKQSAGIEEALQRMQSRLLDRAFELYQEAKPALNRLPKQGSTPMEVAVESYMEIGRVLREEGLAAGVRSGKGKATVPKKRRIGVVWRVLNRQ